MIKPRRPLPSRLIRRRLRPLPVARGLRRRVPGDTQDWQPVGIRWRRLAAPRSAAAAGARMAARSIPAAAAPIPAQWALVADRIAPRGRAMTLPSRVPGIAASLKALGVAGERGANGQPGQPGAPGAARRIDHHWQSRPIVRATAQAIAAAMPPSSRAPAATRPGALPPPASAARQADRQLRARPERIDAGSANAAPRAISFAWRSTAARRAMAMTAPASAATGRRRQPTAMFGPYHAAPGGDVVGLDWPVPQRARPTAASLAALAMRAELVWRAPAPGSRNVTEPAVVDRPSRDAPGMPAGPAAPSIATTTAPPARPVQLDVATTERLVEDVLRRAEQRLRIERERRGL